jgi:hypothetical protein
VSVETIEYSYVFEFEDGSHQQFEVCFDSSTYKLTDPVPKTLPSWTELQHHQCPNCPLTPHAQTHCPAAVAIAAVADQYAEIISHKSVGVRVISPKRTVSGKTTVQRALSSLLGLLIATSDCPHTHFFRPMAYFHLPLASQDETIFRAIATYFLANYFKGEKSAVFNLDDLREIYTNMQTVNEYLVKRIQTDGPGSDATKNAVVLLHLLSCVLPLSLSQSLDNLRPLFKGLLENN